MYIALLLPLIGAYSTTATMATSASMSRIAVVTGANKVGGGAHTHLFHEVVPIHDRNNQVPHRTFRVIQNFSGDVFMG